MTFQFLVPYLSFCTHDLKKDLSPAVEKKSELFDQKSLTSPTCCKFEIFDHDPSFFNFSQKKASHLLVKKKSELLGQKMKNHLPAVILKIFITTPNLRSNFETHKDVGDKF